MITVNFSRDSGSTIIGASALTSASTNVNVFNYYGFVYYPPNTGVGGMLELNKRLLGDVGRNGKYAIRGKARKKLKFQISQLRRGITPKGFYNPSFSPYLNVSCY